MTQLTQEPKCEGNTNLRTDLDDRRRRWAFTLNNWTEEEYDTLTQYFLKRKALYIIGKEIGEECGTPHLQGYFEVKNAVAFKMLKNKWPRVSWRMANGDREQNRIYCSKDGDFVTNIEKELTLNEMLLEDEYSDVKWHDWQQEILDIINGPVDKRKVYWYWSREGDIGKSFLARYISLKYDSIIASGKTNDIFNQTLTWRNNHPRDLQLPPVILDIPKSEYGRCNYASIEALKNGFLYSGKYEGGKVHGKSPHLIVFANREPKIDELSEDRWVIRDLSSEGD